MMESRLEYEDSASYISTSLMVTAWFHPLYPGVSSIFSNVYPTIRPKCTSPQVSHTSSHSHRTNLAPSPEQASRRPPFTASRTSSRTINNAAILRYTLHTDPPRDRHYCRASSAHHLIATRLAIQAASPASQQALGANTRSAYRSLPLTQQQFNTCPHDSPGTHHR